MRLHVRYNLKLNKSKKVDEGLTDCGKEATRTQRSVNHHGCFPRRLANEGLTS